MAIDADLVKSFLNYSPETGLFVWRERFNEHGLPIKNFNTRWAGKPAITAVHSKGYLCGNLFGNVELAHRLAWACAFDEWPAFQIDHINQIKTDNRLTNLRSVTNAENHRNMPMRKNNTSGVTGVYLDKRNGKWVSRVAGKWVGEFQNLSSAKYAVEDFRRELGYSDIHGVRT